MKLEEAALIADEVVQKLRPYCARIQVVGSIRRRKPEVNDIDVVAIVKDPFNFRQEILKMNQEQGKLVRDGEKIQSFIYGHFQANGVTYIQVDIYRANEATWPTLLLIRTGPTESNIHLCSIARSKGGQLKADGSGLYLNEVLVAPRSEEEIYELLGLPYVPPEMRDRL